MSKRYLSSEEVISQAKIIHGDRYNYSLINYKHCKEKLDIICLIHGVFKQSKLKHINAKQGCPKCARLEKSKKQRFNIVEWIDLCNQIHNSKYNYSLVEYINQQTLIKIICPVHGVFEQRPVNHLRLKCGCPKCKVDKMRDDIDSFIIKANIIHKNKYDYSFIDYKNSSTYIKINCPEHGPFKQEPRSHLQGCGCKKCYRDSICLSLSDWKTCVSIIHDKKYNYSLINDLNYGYLDSIVKIICPIHGEFTQIAWNHYQGKGCRKCAGQISKGENELYEFIKSIYNGEVISNDRKIIKPKEIDIYLPELKIGIEYNGNFWHRFKEKRTPGYHKNKAKAFQNNNIKLVNVSEFNWKNNNSQSKQKISRIILEKHFK